MSLADWITAGKVRARITDLDNLAKALLDSLTGNVFEDDHQVARLLVERRVGEREGIWLKAEAMD